MPMGCYFVWEFPKGGSTAERRGLLQTAALTHTAMLMERPSKTYSKHKMKSLRNLVIVLFLVSGAVLAFYLNSVWCYDIFPPRDPENVTREESQQLLDHALQIYRSDTDDYLGRVAAPIAVTVSGKTARLIIAHSMVWGLLEYAQAWQQIYQEHHGGGYSCVTLHLVWKGGHMDQHFPPDWTL